MNYNHFTISSDNGAIISELKRYLIEKQLIEDYDCDDSKSVFASVPDRCTESVTERLKLLSAKNQDEKIDAEVSFEHDWHTNVHLLTFQNGEYTQTGIRRLYMFPEHFIQGKDAQSKIVNALTEYFRKIDDIPQEPEELTVTMMIDDYKVIAKKICCMVDIIDVQKKAMREAWASVKESSPSVDLFPF